MQRIIAVALMAAMLLCVWVQAEGLDELAVQCNSQPQVGAKAAIVIEAHTGRVLFAQNEHKQLPMASTTKIMTALLALEQSGVDAMFTVDPKAIHVEGSSMGLREGDKASLHGLAVGMLLSSGNDAANAAAVRISGNLPAFAEKMNARAAQIGMTNTSFETPSGLDGEHHYSTAYDMALLAREAIANDRFVAICSQYKLRANFGNPPYNRWLKNHNRLLSTYDGAFGVKTGFTRKSGRCLVSAARRDGVELICVTLGCPDDWGTHRNLYDRFFAQLELRDLAEGLPAMNVPVVGGAQDTISAQHYESAPIAVPKQGAAIRYEARLPKFVYAPVQKGQYLGEVDIYLDDQRVFTLSLMAGADVPLLHEYKPGLWERITDYVT